MSQARCGAEETGEVGCDRYRCARFDRNWRRSRPAHDIEDAALKVAASSLRKGSVVDMDGKLYVVLSAENIHPGKGTPVTQLNMRRISDGVKISERYRTTEQVERAIVDDREHTFLYKDGDGYHFMNPVSYDQLTASEDIVGDASYYLQEGMAVTLSVHNDLPIAIELPRLATFEVVETEPSVKGQTASSSYKPAVLSNGLRTMIPPYIGPGTRIVVLTEDGSYVERAKD
jgi:elongation factor P